MGLPHLTSLLSLISSEARPLSIRRGAARSGGVEPVLELSPQLGGERLVVGQPRRPLPLGARLDLATDAPIGVAQVIVDRGVVGIELDSALELLDRVLIIALAEHDPAQAVDDRAVIRQ